MFERIPPYDDALLSGIGEAPRETLRNRSTYRSIIHTFPQAADLIVTDRCTGKCGVCWGATIPSYAALPLERRRQFADILIQGGVKKLGYTGGEPLMDPELPELLSHAHNKGARN